jgi:hypothetical protein
MVASDESGRNPHLWAFRGTGQVVWVRSAYNWGRLPVELELKLRFALFCLVPR